MIHSILRGSAAGAAGTTALNATSYADMALRGRSASDVPAEAAGKLVEDMGLHLGGTGEQRSNRLSALGALGGIGVGVATGVVVSLAHRAGARVPWWLGSLATGVLAMAATDASMTRLGVTDPRTWSPTDWVSDLVPHLVFGAVTYTVVAGDCHP
ncbi:hypothetical protein GT030_34495 [Streptomyces sp. SID1328]|uniref:hypothetical protein n=1 Tax=Streptomyces sp. SID1328 TaxID=2690250 RepID=UPI00137103EB|nr:hypothetical protein [Streptomyces sp. SID1328]MYV43836.1 hypothetical protein [Streptomyces sp. SID1328]